MFVIETPGFSLADTYRTRQSIFWESKHNINGEYFIFQHGNSVLIASQVKQRLLLHCSEEDFFSIWYKYFDLEHDYYYDLMEMRLAVPFLTDVARSAPGIHIIDQGAWESHLTSFLLSSHSWEESKRAAYDMCIACNGGPKKKNAPGIGSSMWAPIPAPSDVLEKLNEEDALWYIDKSTALELMQCASEFIETNLPRSISTEESMSQKQKKTVLSMQWESVSDWLEWQEAGLSRQGYIKAMLKWHEHNANIPGMVKQKQHSKSEV